MIFLFGDYGVYTRDAAIYGLKGLFDENDVPCQILTLTLDSKLQRNRAAVASGFKPGSIWSIYDAFTGRMLQEDRKYTPMNYEAPKDYKATAGVNSKKYVKFDGSAIELVTRTDGTIESVEFYEGDHLVRRENYDDGGYLVTIEYPLGEEDIHTKIIDQRGNVIFELYQIGKYRKVGKVKFVPENIDFLSENEFLKWAFERLVTVKNPADKFFIVSEPFRKAIQTATFDKSGVYLLQTAFFNENNSKDIMFDHYEKIIFNSYDELNKVMIKFDEKTDSKLYWNNFLALNKIVPNYEIDKFPVYLNLGKESDSVKFADVIEFVKTAIEEEPKVRFIIEFSLLRDQVNFLSGLTEAGLTEEMVKERVVPLTRPWPERVAEEMAKAVLYIHYQNAEILSLPLATAIAAEKPILALPGDPLLTDYLEEENGKVISDTSVSRLIKQAIYDIDFIHYVASDPSRKRESLSPENTMARWNTIFEDEEIKI